MQTTCEFLKLTKISYEYLEYALRMLGIILNEFFLFFRFFLMYLIGKDETEYTGQETYVWDMYQQRCWDFFPAGECFTKQYESELGEGG